MLQYATSLNCSFKPTHFHIHPHGNSAPEEILPLQTQKIKSIPGNIFLQLVLHGKVSCVFYAQHSFQNINLKAEKMIYSKCKVVTMLKSYTLPNISFHNRDTLLNKSRVNRQRDKGRISSRRK